MLSVSCLLHWEELIRIDVFFFSVLFLCFVFWEWFFCALLVVDVDIRNKQRHFLFQWTDSGLKSICMLFISKFNSVGCKYFMSIRQIDCKCIYECEIILFKLYQIWMYTSIQNIRIKQEKYHIQMPGMPNIFMDFQYNGISTHVFVFWLRVDRSTSVGTKVFWSRKQSFRIIQNKIIPIKILFMLDVGLKLSYSSDIYLICSASE